MRESDGTRRNRPSPWGSAVTIVAKSDGAPRFCVDYRWTINKNLIKQSWPMPNLESHLDKVGRARYITVCDVQNAYHQIPVAERGQDKTAFVTQNGKWVSKRLPFGIANAPFLFSRIMSLAFEHFCPKSGLLVYMDDCICCRSTWAGHFQLLPGQATFSYYLGRPLSATRNFVQSLASSRPHPQTIESTVCPPRS